MLLEMHSFSESKDSFFDSPSEGEFQNLHHKPELIPFIFIIMLWVKIDY
jgi:hypothetical protein